MIGRTLNILLEKNQNKFDELNDICKVMYLPRTPSISTTEIVEIIKTNSN